MFTRDAGAPQSAHPVYRTVVATVRVLVVLVDFLELGVNNTVVRCAGTSITFSCTLGRSLLSIKLLRKRTGGFAKCRCLLLNSVLVVAIERRLEVGNRILNRETLFSRGFLAKLVEGLLCSVNQAIGLVARIYELAELAVLFGVALSIGDHLVDLVIRQTRRRLDHNVLALAGCLVLRRHIQNTVGVDVERDFDLRQAARCRRDVRQVEATQRLVVRRALALTLQHVNRYGCLVVVCRREHLLRICRNRRVLVDQLGHDTTQRLDTERQRRYVEQQDVLDVTGEDTTLNGGAERYGLIRIHIPTRLLAEEVLHLFLDLRHARLATDKDNVVNFVHLEASIVERDLAGLNRACDEPFYERLQLGACQLDVQVLRT